MTIESEEVKLAKQLFLDAVNGNMAMPLDRVATLARSSLDYAVAFYCQVPKHSADDIVTVAVGTVKGCPICFGSGGKVKMRCKNCHGTGKVPA